MLVLKENDPQLEFAGTTPNGLMKYNYEGEPFTGLVEYWEDAGYKSGETEYVDGVPQGGSRSYYPNGQIEEESYSWYGRIDKYFKKWDEKGNLIIHSTWDKGTKLEHFLPE